MAFNEYIQSGGKYLRCGYTTGTCAALAASAAARLLLTGRAPESVSLITPKGLRVEVVPEVCEYVPEVCGAVPQVCENVSEGGYSQMSSGGSAPAVDHMDAQMGSVRAARAAVRKDAGDDRDVTDGILIYATVRIPGDGTEREALGDSPETSAVDIYIDGGPGVGRVTRPGLDQPVGNAAINHVPREMIEKAVRNVCEFVGYQGRILVEISVPEGEKIAKKTFNAHLGIEGGISILGTSGIVEPMSMQAFIDAVCVEIRQVRRMNESGRLILTPGNYGMDFLREYLGKKNLADNKETGTENSGENLGENDRTNGRENGEETSAKNSGGIASKIPVVACSNFIGDALDAAAAEGFREVLLVGHIGKLVKLAGGVMNTHSRYADCRMELFAAHAAICGVDSDVCRRLMACVTTDACLEILREEGICQEVMDALLLSMEKYLHRRVAGAYRVGAMTFSNVHGPLGATPEAREILRGWGLMKE